MSEKVLGFIFSEYLPEIKDDIEFIQINLQDGKLDYVVASNMKEVRRIMEQDGNKGYAEWHSEDVDLVGWNKLLEDNKQVTVSSNIATDLNKISDVLYVLGDSKIRITKDNIKLLND